MADISAIKLPNGTTYDFKDSSTYHVATYSNTSGSNNGKYYKISINSYTSWMLVFRICVYHQYETYEFEISGYNYGSSHWYSPAAMMVTSSYTRTIDVSFGYDSNWHLWVAFPAAQYSGVSVSLKANGYYQVEDEKSLFTIELVDGLPETVQATKSCTRPWYRNETVSNATNAGNASTVNNHTVNSDVPTNAKFTDTVTTVSTTGSGNAITAISASNGALTATKGATFLTSHQDISGKADKSVTVSTVTYDYTNKKITKTINGATTDVVTVAALKTALGSMPASDVYSWAKASTKPTYTASEVGAQPTLVSGTNIKTINSQSLLGSGDISISSDVSDVQVDGTSIVNQQGVANINPAIFLDFFYRVGSYYETSDSTFDPNVEWGGTWVLETPGLVHVSGGTGDANYPVSGTFTDANGGKGKKQDGYEDAIVPTHNHDIKAQTTGGPSNNTSGGQSQGHTHSPSNATNFMYYDTDVSGNNVGRRNIGSGSGSYHTWTAAKTDALKASTVTSGASQGHTHSLQNHTHTLGAHSTEDKGVSGKNKNMQPYINVYRWHRIA